MIEDADSLIFKPPSYVMAGLARRRLRVAELAGERELLDAELQSIEMRISHLELDVGEDSSREAIKARDRRRHTLDRLALCRREFLVAEQEMHLWRDALMYLSRR